MIDLIARWAVAQTNRLDSIVVNLQEPDTEEGRLEKQRTNKQALKRCIESLENNIPIAIAPSGGKTHEGIENPVYPTIVPTLASMFFKRGKVVKIVPCVIKERPKIDNKTFKRYIADRIFIYKGIRWLLNLLKIKSYKKKNLQQLIYSTLREG
jgi:hypothetical protein